MISSIRAAFQFSSRVSQSSITGATEATARATSERSYGRRAGREAGAHRESELGLDAEGKEIARGNFSRRVEAGGRKDARREWPGGADQRL